MTKEELIKKIYAEIAKLSDNASQTCEEYEGYRLACQDISDVLHEITKEIQPSLPSDIDEAAEEIASDIAPTHPDIGWDECFEKIKDGIKVGAEWMAGQGVSVDGKVVMDFSEPYDIINRRLIAKLGDALLKVEPGEVIVQIRKKQ